MLSMVKVSEGLVTRLMSLAIRAHKMIFSSVDVLVLVLQEQNY